MSEAHATVTELADAWRVAQPLFRRRKTLAKKALENASDPIAAYRNRQLLSITETAELLGISPHLIRGCIRRRDSLFPYVRIGRRIFIRRAGVFAAFGLE